MQVKANRMKPTLNVIPAYVPDPIDQRPEPSGVQRQLVDRVVEQNAEAMFRQYKAFLRHRAQTEETAGFAAADALQTPLPKWRHQDGLEFSFENYDEVCRANILSAIEWLQGHGLHWDASQGPPPEGDMPSADGFWRAVRKAAGALARCRALQLDEKLARETREREQAEAKQAERKTLQSQLKPDAQSVRALMGELDTHKAGETRFAQWCADMRAAHACYVTRAKLHHLNEQTQRAASLLAINHKVRAEPELVKVPEGDALVAAFIEMLGRVSAVGR